MLGIMALLQTGCQTTGFKEKTEDSWYCTAFLPITWSAKDTTDTALQIVEHNAVWTSLCTTIGNNDAKER